MIKIKNERFWTEHGEEIFIHFENKKVTLYIRDLNGNMAEAIMDFDECNKLSSLIKCQ